MSRELAAIARRFADTNSDRLADASTSPAVFGTVVAVNPLKVRRRGGDVDPAGRCSRYTPVVGDRVLCVYDDNHQLVVIDHVVSP